MRTPRSLSAAKLPTPVQAACLAAGPGARNSLRLPLLPARLAWAASTWGRGVRMPAPPPPSALLLPLLLKQQTSKGAATASSS